MTTAPPPAQVRQLFARVDFRGRDRGDCALSSRGRAHTARRLPACAWGGRPSALGLTMSTTTTTPPTMATTRRRRRRCATSQTTTAATSVHRPDGDGDAIDDHAPRRRPPPRSRPWLSSCRRLRLTALTRSPRRPAPPRFARLLRRVQFATGFSAALARIAREDGAGSLFGGRDRYS